MGLNILRTKKKPFFYLETLSIQELRLICSYLDVKSLAAFQQTNRKIRKEFMLNIWKHLLVITFAYHADTAGKVQYHKVYKNLWLKKNPTELAKEYAREEEMNEMRNEERKHKLERWSHRAIRTEQYLLLIYSISFIGIQYSDNFEYSKACDTVDDRTLSKLQAAKQNRPMVMMLVQQVYNRPMIMMLVQQVLTILEISTISTDKGIKTLEEDIIWMTMKSVGQFCNWIYMLLTHYEVKPWLTYNAPVGDLICNITKEGFGSIGIQICMWISFLLFLQDSFILFLSYSLLRMMKTLKYQRFSRH